MRRRAALDPIAVLVLLGLAVSAIGFALGGGARIILIRESFFTGALGLVCLASLAVAPRPLMFYFGRWFATQGDPEKVAEYDANWSRQGFRRVNRRITLVWGISYLSEFAIRVAMAMTLPTAVVLAAGPLILTAITAATIAWTFSYARRARRRAIAAGAVESSVAFGAGRPATS
jgi:4-amino-4-deoxy-L-arabinose transferase-like glycosyltransferase